MYPLQPLGNKVIVLRDPPQERLGKERLILASDGAKEVQSTGIVKAVGPGTWSNTGQHFLPTVVCKDTRVVLPPQGFEVLWQFDKTGRTCVVREDQLLAIVREPVCDPSAD